MNVQFPSASQATPATAKNPGRFLLVVPGAVVLAACLLLAVNIQVRAASGQAGAEANKPQPLDLKPGLWELRVNISTSGMFDALPPETMRQITANMTPEQRAKFVADLDAKTAKAEQAAKKGTDQKMKSCPLNQDFEGQISVDAFTDRCTKTLRTSGQELHLHVLCPASMGTPESEQTSDFKRIDSENFEGTIQVITRDKKARTRTETFVGKWVADSCSGPPAGAVAKSGVQLKGPAAIAHQDPNRIVAVADGKPITAREAWNLIDKVPPATRRTYDSRMLELLQKLYLQNAIVEEAVKLHLDTQQPWKDQLYKTKQNDIQHVQNYAGDPNIPPEVWQHWLNDRAHILYNAFFTSQASTKEARQELMNQEKEKYKITVQDPDFFTAVEEP